MAGLKDIQVNNHNELLLTPVGFDVGPYNPSKFQDYPTLKSIRHRDFLTQKAVQNFCTTVVV